MTALKTRNRLVNFRLTEEEYDRLAAVCSRRGSPSISDFARAAILRSVEFETATEALVERRLTAVDDRVSRLEAGFLRLASTVSGRDFGPNAETEPGTTSESESCDAL